MGVFDAPSPFLAVVGGLFDHLLPEAATIAVWGLCVGSVATTIYWFLSPQERIVRIRNEAYAVRNALLHYDGDFRGVLTLSRKSLALSLREIGLVIGPAVAAAVPALCSITYLGNVYDYVLPSAGTTVAVRIDPLNAAVQWTSPSAIRTDGVWRVQWPKRGEQLQLMSGRRVLTTLPLSRPIPVIRKFVWWNIFLGNPAGYIPAVAKVSAIELRLAPRDFLPFGPQWIRGWETIFFFFAGTAALIFRKVLAVH